MTDLFNFTPVLMNRFRHYREIDRRFSSDLKDYDYDYNVYVFSRYLHVAYKYEIDFAYPRFITNGDYDFYFYRTKEKNSLQKRVNELKRQIQRHE